MVLGFRHECPFRNILKCQSGVTIGPIFINPSGVTGTSVFICLNDSTVTSVFIYRNDVMLVPRVIIQFPYIRPTPTGALVRCRVEAVGRDPLPSLWFMVFDMHVQSSLVR